MKNSDLRKIIDLLGPDGAKAGLSASYVTDRELASMLRNLTPKKPVPKSRDSIIDKIMDASLNKIDLTLNQLKNMNYDSLKRYLDDLDVSDAELILVLHKLNIHPSSQDRRSLRRFAARHISEEGMMERVTRGQN